MQTGVMMTLLLTHFVYVTYRLGVVVNGVSDVTFGVWCVEEQ
jgi:hypothetical protein